VEEWKSKFAGMETQMERFKETLAAMTEGASARPRKETPKAVLEKSAKFTDEKGKTAPVRHTWLLMVRQYLPGWRPARCRQRSGSCTPRHCWTRARSSCMSS